jgi:hypothetical protein
LLLISALLLKNGLNIVSVSLLEKLLTQENISLFRVDAALVSVSVATGTVLSYRVIYCPH